MSRQLNDLSERFRPKAFELLARLTEAGIPVLIVDTLRTPAEHAENLRKGTSKATRSKHLDGDAIDICPYSVFLDNGPDKLNWNTSDPVWKRIGEIVESVGLTWGGRWKNPHDPGHAEWKP
jgi:hypothetical protein